MGHNEVGTAYASRSNHALSQDRDIWRSSRSKRSPLSHLAWTSGSDTSAKELACRQLNASWERVGLRVNTVAASHAYRDFLCRGAHSDTTGNIE